jgi:hypothetical protein
LAGGSPFNRWHRGGAAPFGFKGAVFDFAFSPCPRSSPGVNPDQPILTFRVMRPTAPRPVFRMNNQFSFHRIRMHILQFLPNLLPAPHIEVIEPPLPKRRQGRGLRKRQRQLPRSRLPPFPPQRAGDLLFKHLQRFRRRTFLRLTDQQVHVFRHHHIPDQSEAISRPYFLQDFHKPIPRPPRPQEGSSAVAAESNKVEIASPVIASQRVAHRRKTRTLKTEGCGTLVYYLHRVVPHDILPPCHMANQILEARSLGHPPCLYGRQLDQKWTQQGSTSDGYFENSQHVPWKMRTTMK